jgi:hypothetical protein
MSTYFGRTTLLLLALGVWPSATCRAEQPSQQAHWAYRAPRLPAIPAVRAQAWTREPIDRFILARLETEQLSPASEADRATLIRRASLDLTGLPPTLDEIAAFLADDSPDAYERLVDRLLASPRYGERMASDWLDLARYADTHGYHSDSQRQMWRWRDWVVDSLNADVPFDRFTIEQLAGDLLPEATLDQRIATGFHRNTMLNDENGAIPEEYLAEYAIDRVNTTGSVWLGQSVGCARCHDHKHDPLTQRDFYRLFAFFNNVPENGLGGRYGNAPPVLAAPTRRAQWELASLARQQKQLSKQLAARATAARAAQLAWEQTAGDGELAQPPSDAILHLKFDETEGATAANAAEAGQSFPVKGSPAWTFGKFGGALLCDGATHVEAAAAPRWERTDRFTLAAWVFPTTADTLPIVAAVDETQYRRGWEFSLEKNHLAFRLTNRAGANELLVQSLAEVKQRRWQHVLATYDGSSRASGVTLYLDGQPLPTKVVSDNLSAHVQTDLPLLVGRSDAKTGFRGLIDEVQVFGRTLSAAEAGLVAGSDPIQTILQIAAADRTAAQAAAVRQYFWENIDRPSQQLYSALQQCERRQAEIERQAPSVMVMQELPTPRDTFVLERGMYDQPGEKVTAGVPAFLPELPAGEPHNRLGLARWLVAPNHPLTGRVTVNRAWQTFFGTGLVRTADDFGTHGERPSHGELLDFLARSFVDDGWQVKRLHRQIVTSATYRQASETSPELLARDRENRLLARGPRGNLPAETIRDSALFAAGLLNLQQGGPGVRPYQPAELWRELAYDPEAYTAQIFIQSHGADLYRRSLYTFWKRSVPPPNLSLFDAPNRETCVATRSATSSPLQVLVLLNDTTFVEAARELATRVLKGSPVTDGDEARLRQAFAIVLSRPPLDREMQVLQSQLAAARQEYRADPTAAKALLSVGELPTDAQFAPAELAAWTTIASLLFNLDDAVKRH